MKNILKVLLACFIFFTAVSCNKNQEANHELAWNESGNDSIVKVQSYDSNGNLLEYYMYYTMFNNLFSRGGYGAVNNYYSSHRSSFDSNYGSYNKRYVHKENPKGFDYLPSKKQNSAYRSSSPIRSTENYKKSSPVSRSNSTYKSTSSPSRYKSTTSSSYKSSSPSRSSYKSSSPSSSYKSSSSSSYRNSSPSRSSSSSHRTSSPSRSSSHHH